MFPGKKFMMPILKFRIANFKMRINTKFKIRIPQLIRIIPFLFLVPSLNVYSQEQVIDQVVAVVGGKIILKSDIEKQYYQFIAQGGERSIDGKCLVFDQLLLPLWHSCTTFP